MNIFVSREFTKTPGGRYMSGGTYSGQQFRDELLKPRYLESISRNEELVVYLDGGYGYGSSFLEESFGGLARDLKSTDLSIRIVSDEEPELIEQIKEYIKNALEE
jgi:hypothetical protein